jgi:hypothetical protein
MPHRNSSVSGWHWSRRAPTSFASRSLFGMPADWKGRRGSLDNIVAGLEAGREMPAFTDRTISPSYIVDIAAATRYLVDCRLRRTVFTTA